MSPLHHYLHALHTLKLLPMAGHTLLPLKQALRGRRFSCDDDVKAAVHQWLRAQPKTFFADGIKMLVGRWEKCIEKQGDYIEMWGNLLLKFLINRFKKKSAETFWRSLVPNSVRQISQYYVLFYECIWHGCKRNGIPLSAHFMYPNNVLCWPEDGYFIAETCCHIINWNFVILWLMLCL